MEESNFKKYTIRTIGIIVSCLIAAINIKVFVRVGNLFPAGFSGVTILIQRTAETYFGIELPYSPIYYILNIVPVYIGFKYIGKRFTLFSLLDVVLLGVFTDLIPTIPVTYDMLLISVFGGIISGVSGAMVLSVGASGGGTDFISMFLSEKKGIDAFQLMLFFNIAILVVAGLLFGWDKALYSIIYQYVSTQVLRMFYKRFQQDTLFIVTEFPEEVCMAINEVTHHGATTIKAEGAFMHAEKTIVYSVVSASQSRGLVRDIRIVDPQAFVNVIRTQQVGGRFYQARHD